jgi:predicted amidohydrolase
MGDTLRVACVQLSAGAEKGANLATAERLVYGRSFVCDPWGTPLGELPDGDGVAVAELDASRKPTLA